MGIITLEKSDHLFWLGRYTERVHTTLKMYLKSSDRMIDSDPDYYAAYCKKIGITNIYGSRENFAKTYPFDESDPNSIISNLNRAYDNAIVIRDYIGTETMAYIQLAIDDIKAAERGDTPIAAPGEKLNEYHKNLELDKFSGTYDKALHIMHTLYYTFSYIKGDTLAEIIDPYTGMPVDMIKSPVNGIVFFHADQPVIYSQAPLYRIIPTDDLY